MSNLPKKAADQVQPLLVDVKAIARMLSTSVRSVWRLKSGGKFPRSVRVGRSVRWDVETIRRWIDLGCPDRDTFESQHKNEARSQAEKGGNRKHVA